MKQLYYADINTPIGTLTAVSDDQFLYVLHFSGSDLLKKHLFNLQSNLRETHSLQKGVSDPLVHITQELELYFERQLTTFQTPIFFGGSDFQNKVWNELQKVSYGSAIAYSSVAKKIGHEKAHRAAASAVAQNPLLIIIPCHRVIQKSGDLGDYAKGKTQVKRQLLEIEQYDLQKTS